ncbi:GNAT family N-acetyltransferase [Pontibacter indicus]|uniref:Acetyltransferase (GNAT) domain-containing protein n=1 Tax=Pontibacter indicus TaxID=1317125 RepID=A0A1R3WBI9_9BACT|nr:GNAT family N-acetyltransferase [Pontibacter indicus]SIT75415.1 Acetyltransferase (GNAT) domain-containing protein [Pontibacter indicus]
MQELVIHKHKDQYRVDTGISSTSLLIGKEFWELYADNNFQKNWDSLYRNCSWATAFQSREFVMPWYQVFAKEYLPVVVTSHINGELCGLLTMALPNSGASIDQLGLSRIQIIGAGAYEAEYQVWLAEEGVGEFFIKEALFLLKERFPKSDILFRFLPAQTPIGWTKTEKIWQSCCVIQEFKRPLLELQSASVAQHLQITRQHKTKYNRLKRTGNLVFEKITDSEQFTTVLNDLAEQYDFRQGVMFNMNQFRENPFKKDFLIQLFRNGILHVTIMRLNNEIIAAMVAVQGKNWVHLQGLNTHSPFHAKNSPGMLHFFMLGRCLSNEGYNIFDLTPGGDGYKERFATAYDQVYSLVVTDNIPYRLKRRARKLIYDRLIKSGHRPMSVELNLKKKLYTLRHQFKAISHGNFYRYKKADASHYLYKIPPLLSSKIPISINSLKDLLNFETGGTHVSRWEFLEDAMRRFENGQHTYTWAEGGRLLCCAWLYTTESQHKYACFEINYCHPEVREHLREFLAKSETVAAIYHKAYLPYVIKATEKQICKALELTENIQSFKF